MAHVGFESGQTADGGLRSGASFEDEWRGVIFSVARVVHLIGGEKIAELQKSIKRIVEPGQIATGGHQHHQGTRLDFGA